MWSSSIFFLPPSLLLFFLHRFVDSASAPSAKQKSARSELAGPLVSWLIAEVSLCQMNNRVSLPITNLPARAWPWFVYSALRQGDAKTHPPLLFPPKPNLHQQSVRCEKYQWSAHMRVHACFVYTHTHTDKAYFTVCLIFHETAAWVCSCSLWQVLQPTWAPGAQKRIGTLLTDNTLYCAHATHKVYF